MSLPPNVADWFAVRCEYSDRELRLLLEWREYSRELGATAVKESREVCFAGVDDLDALPPLPLQPRYRAGRLVRLLDRVFRPVGLRFEVTQLGTARDLIECIDQAGDRGQPLGPIEAVGEGFVVVVLVCADYYVRARSVTWRGPSEGVG